MDKFEKISEIVTKITGKKIVSKDKALTQDLTNIYAKYWPEILHEFAHYVVATEEERLDPNLGFYTPPECYKNPTKHMVEQEIRASLLNHELNLLVGFSDNKEKSYSEYIRNVDKNFEYSKTFGENAYEEIEKELPELLKRPEVVSFINHINFI